MGPFEKRDKTTAHEINIENKLECMKRIDNIANLSLDMGEHTRRENISATNVRNNDRSWNVTFAMLVEYVCENFRLPSQVDGPIADNGKTKLGQWYANERRRAHTTARGVCMQGMKEITSILYNGRHLCNHGPNDRIRVKNMAQNIHPAQNIQR
jgi:hypothetical protein